MAKHPISSFVGLALIVLLFIGMSFAHESQSSELKEAALHPRVGDTFVMSVKGETGKEHVLMTVIAVGNGSVDTHMSSSTYPSVASARRAFVNLAKANRARLLDPNPLRIPLSDFSNFELRDVVRDSI